MSGRATPFHCPYCAGEDLRPREEHGGWECHACLRAFTVRYLGQLRRPAGIPPTGPALGPEVES